MVNAKAAFDGESKLRRSKYSAMSPSAYAKLKPQANKVLVWVRTPSLAGLTSLSKAVLNAKLAIDKTKALTGLAGLSGVTLMKDVAGLPLFEVEASKSGIHALAKRPEVVRIDPVVRGPVRAMSHTFDQTHMNWPNLFWQDWQWPITSEVKIAMVEQCHPHRALRTHDPSSSLYAYLPSIVEEQLADYSTHYCGSGGDPTEPAKALAAHANATHSILYGHRDYTATTPRARPSTAASGCSTRSPGRSRASR